MTLPNFRIAETVCPYCGVGCRVYLVIRDEEVVGVERVFDHPSNAGTLCPKGENVWLIINHPKRLRRPLVRTERGFREASWGEVIRLIIDELKRIRKDDPMRAYFLASARCTNEENYLLQKLARVYVGTNNIDNCVRLCHSPTLIAMRRSLGYGAATNPLSDLVNSRTVLILGLNPVETHLPMMRFVSKAKALRGCKVIVADPRKTLTAINADVHLQLRPGTDVVLVNTFIRVVIDHGLVDEDFVSKYVDGFDELVEEVKKLDLSRASRVTGVPKRLIEEAAITYAENKPSSICFGMGLTQHIGSVDAVQSLVNLALITGNIGKPGAGIYPARGQLNVQGACDMGALPDFYPGYREVSNEEVKELEELWGCELPRWKGLYSTELWDRVLSGEVELLYIVGTNPALSWPNHSKILVALSRAGFVIVQDIFMTETAEYADVVLPAATWVEKEGTITNTERRVQLISRIIDPPGEARSDLDIFLMIMRRLEPPATYASAEDVFEEIRKAVPEYRGISYARLREERYGIFWPCPSTSHAGTSVLYTNGFSKLGGKARVFPVEVRNRYLMEDEDYPYILITGRVLTQYNTGTMTRKVLELMLREGITELHISPKDAWREGLKDGDTVVLETPYGRGEVVVKISSDLPGGTLFISNHFANPPANLFTGGNTDKLSGIAELKGVPARLLKS